MDLILEKLNLVIGLIQKILLLLDSGIRKDFSRVNDIIIKIWRRE